MMNVKHHTFTPAPDALQDASTQALANVLIGSYRHWTGLDLLSPPDGVENRACRLFEAPFALVSHGTEHDPIFNFGNRMALGLFELPWAEFTRMHSQRSAEPPCRDERAALLARVTEHGFIRDYQGVRITSSGRRFEISQATVWNLVDDACHPCGQAAMFSDWRWL